MSEKPILFSGAMVRAILEGRKTQTRRVMKPQPWIVRDGYVWSKGGPERGPWAGWDAGNEPKTGTRKKPGVLDLIENPYGLPGDRLWVKETWGVVNSLDEVKPSKLPKVPIIYRATSAHPNERYQMWRPSIFMMRKMSRITLEIVSVRVERLQSISEEDAKAEGSEPHPPSVIDGKIYRRPFNCLWEQINGKESWDENPWVWVVEFKKL